MGSATRNVETVKIGVLCSLSGALSATELWHLQGTMLGVDIVNAEGGIDGRRLEPILCNPASAEKTYRTMALNLIGNQGLANVFGCCSSDVRKSLITAFEQHDALLWYPTQFEGFEWSPNVVYGGSCPNQHTLPLADYLLRRDRSRFILIGTDYGFPRVSNQVFREYVERFDGQVVSESYLPRGAPKEHWMAKLEPCAGKADAIFSTVVGADNEALFEAYHALGLSAAKVPIVGFCVCESVVARHPELYAGHISVLPYFESVSSYSNDAFLKKFHERFGRTARANWLSLTSYLQIQTFAAAARLAGSDSVQDILKYIGDIDLDTPAEGYGFDKGTHYSRNKPHISIANDKGRFELVHVHDSALSPDPYLIATP